MNYSADLLDRINTAGANNADFATIHGVPVKYSTLSKDIRGITAFFNKENLKHKDVIVIMSDNDRARITTAIAALLNGITFCLLPVELEGKQLRESLRDLQPARVFVDSERIEEIGSHPAYPTTEIKKEGSAGLLSRVFNNRKRVPSHFPAIAQYLTPDNPTLLGDADDIACVSYTAGTDNHIQGAALTYQNLFESLESLKTMFGITADSHIENSLNLAHYTGLNYGPLIAAYCCAKLRVHSPLNIENLEPQLHSLYLQGISHFFLTPEQVELICKFAVNIDHFDYESLKHIINVGDKLPHGDEYQFRSRFSIGISSCYGLAETSGVSIYNVWNNHHLEFSSHKYRIGTIGMSLDCQMMIARGDGSLCAVGEVGEIWIKGQTVVPGYFQKGQITALPLKDGWFATGDMAKTDIDGFIHLVGTKANYFVSEGALIDSRRIDAIQKQFDHVNKSVTFLEDGSLTKLATSVVEAKSTAASAARIFHQTKNQLNELNHPKQVFVVSQLPRGITGKIRIGVLKRQLPFLSNYYR